MIGKRGQKIESPTVHVAIFVLVLGLIIVGYLILLPQTEREKILGAGEEYYPEGSEEGGELDEEVMLSVSPGNVYPYSKEVEEKSLASVNLYSTTKTDPIMLADRVVVTKSLLVNKYKELYFDVDNLADLESLGLFFNTGEASGDLIVIINNNEVYRGRVRGGDLPITIPGEYLKQYNNQLILEASHPGVFILSTNKFILKDVQLIKQINLVNKIEFRNFVIDNIDSLRKGVLSFFVNCLKVNVDQGILKVGLNGKNAYLGKVVCDAGTIDLDLLRDYFIEGRNTLTFEIDNGEYILEQVKLELDVEDRQLVQYYFSVDEKEGDYILEMSFLESDEVKRGTITINGDNIYLDSYKNSYSKDVTNLIDEGENYIKISAKNEFFIDMLEIVQE